MMILLVIMWLVITMLMMLWLLIMLMFLKTIIMIWTTIMIIMTTTTMMMKGDDDNDNHTMNFKIQPTVLHLSSLHAVCIHHCSVNQTRRLCLLYLGKPLSGASFTAALRRQPRDPHQQGYTSSTG